MEECTQMGTRARASESASSRLRAARAARCIIACRYFGTHCMRELTLSAGRIAHNFYTTLFQCSPIPEELTHYKYFPLQEHLHRCAQAR